MREILQLLLLAVAILAAGIGVYYLIFERRDAPPMTLEAVAGTVRVDAGGRSETALSGTRLYSADRVITGRDGEAVIGFGQGSQLTLAAESSLRVIGSEGDEVQVELEGGRAIADVRPGSDGLQLLAGRRAVRATDARFEAAVREDGAAAVEVGRGQVELEGFGAIRGAGAGERVLAPAGGAPSRAPVPEALLLEVAWPERRTREETVVIRGESEPGALVTVRAPTGDIVLRADEQGHFQLRLPLSGGENPVLIRAEGLLGDSAVAEEALTRDDEGPRAEFEVRY